MTKTIQEQLVKHLDEAYALETQVLRMLDGMIKTTESAQIRSDLEAHKEETQRHRERVKGCLSAYGASPSKVKEAAGIAGALMKKPLDMARSEQAMRNARDGFATEHLEIATYRLIERLAERAGDEKTVKACRENVEEEERMAARIASSWDDFVAEDLAEQGVVS